MRQRYTYLIPIIGLTALSFWRVLTFTFWKDDWWQIWAAIYKPSSFLPVWVHPGTPIEFLLTAPIFGTNPLYWQLLGLVLHIGIALSLGIFIQVLTKSRFAGRLSAVFYSVSFAGMDAIGWPSAHVVLWSSVFLLIGLYYFTMFVREKIVSSLWISLLYMGIALILDPFRLFPVFLILPMIAYIHDKSIVNRIVRTEALVGTLGIISIVCILGYIINWSQIVTHLSHLYLIGNYFNSLSNLFLGWVIRFQEDGSTGIYNPFWARFGFFIFCVTLGIGYEYFQNKRKEAGILFFLLVWIFLFYIPNWLFEPRLTMGGTHRYLVISSLGFIGLTGYALSLIRNRTITAAIAAFFIIVNIVTANHFSNTASEYRSSFRIDTFWKKIDTDVPPNMTKLVFVFTGENPVKTYALSFSGGYPIALRRKISDPSGIPIITEDRVYLEKLLCQGNVPLNHIFSWNVKDTGTLINESLSIRKEMLIQAMDHNCVPVIDQAAIKENI